MPDWRKLRVEGFGPIDRVVAIFQIGPPLERLPFPSFKVKVIERANGSFLAIMNVAARGSDGCGVWEAGLGNTVEEALEDALRRFIRILDEQVPLAETDFIWSDPTEF
jgi:hypothetical protein